MAGLLAHQTGSTKRLRKAIRWPVFSVKNLCLRLPKCVQWALRTDCDRCLS
jgi:hypothetical protein